MRFPPAGVVIALALAARTDAHRLDEYLQATRIGIAGDRVNVEIDLTPGVAVARGIFGLIDTDGDGLISKGESAAYADLVLRSVSLSADDERRPLRVSESYVPPFGEMSEGAGIIRVRASAALPKASRGRHRLIFANGHRPADSVYLVNALVPEDPKIAIVEQKRDRAQQEFTVDYEVGGEVAPVRWLWLPAGLLVGCLWLVTGMRKRGPTFRSE